MLSSFVICPGRNLMAFLVKFFDLKVAALKQLLIKFGKTARGCLEKKDSSKVKARPNFNLNSSLRCQDFVDRLKPS